eukprot:scaffold13478_cov132-Cylindrotheca_fusiformis.AAC.37
MRKRSRNEMENQYGRLFRLTLRVASCAFLVSHQVSGFLQAPKLGKIGFRTTLRFSEDDEDTILVDDSAGSGTLVLTKEKGRRQLSTSPPWLKRIEQIVPDVVETEIDSLILSLSEHQFSEGDIADIIRAIYISAASDVRLVVGSIEFCQLILRLEEPDEHYNLLVTKEVILASILHYSECVTARQDGVYDEVQKAIRMDENDGFVQQSIFRGLPGSFETRKTELENSRICDGDVFPPSSISLRQKFSDPDKREMSVFSPEALRLAEEASRIKRAEILTDVILTDSRALTKAEYGEISNMLLSVTRDWRALAIRCAASLYRLEGYLWDMPVGTGEYSHRDTAATLNARYSIRVYANLSQRMGLHRLQSQLEGSAFRILYPRQFSAVSALFQQKGEAMRAVSSFLSKEITALINDDQPLVEQLEKCEIQARVKSPFSFWKKLVKKRKKGVNGSLGLLSPTSAITVADVLDGVALRVIIKGCTAPTDDEDQIDAHERMLCYYVHHLIRSQWPATDPSRVKDYIKKPKPNGYQSLHHTSSITYNDQVIPFEVQVRSEKMHRIAEFGVAAHWDYKAGNKKLLPSSLASMPSSSKPAATQDPNAKFGEINSAYIHALRDARESLVRSNVYVFLAGTMSESEGGHLLSLHPGSQIMDVLNELGEKFDLEATKNSFQVWLNGQLASPDEVVRNGDVILLQNMSGKLRPKGPKKLAASS